MPFIKSDEVTTSSPFQGMLIKSLVNKDNGAVALTVGDASLEPGKGVPLHIHPTHEEAIVVLEGSIEGVLGDETRILRPGDVLLAPAGIKHNITNKSGRPARAMTIFPTNSPKRTLV